MKDLRQIIAENLPLINTLNWLSFFGLSITTLYTANITALARLEASLGEYAYLAPAAALGIGFVVLIFFDYDLRKNVVTSLQAFWAPDWATAGRGLKAVVIFFVFIAAIRLALSTGATIISGAFMADNLVQDENTDHLEKMMSEKLETKQSIALGMGQQIIEIKESAYNEATRLENAAIDKGGASWAKLWRENNSWIRTVSGPEYRHIEKWRAGIYAAQKKGDKLIAAANEEMRHLRQTSAAMIDAETKDATFAAVAKAKVMKVEKAQRRENLLQLQLWSFDGLFFIIAVLSSFGLVIGLQCRPDYRIFRDAETTAWEVLRESIYSIWRIVVSYGVAMVAGLDAKAASVTANLSHGTGSVDLSSRAVDMRRVTPDVVHAPFVAPGVAPLSHDATMHAPFVADIDATKEKKAPPHAPPHAPEVPSSRGGAWSDLSDTVSHVEVKYVDMKNHIDRIAKRYKRAWNAGDNKKMKEIVADKKGGVAWLQTFGFDVVCDEKTGRMKVKKTYDEKI